MELRKVRILVADDSPADRELIRRSLLRGKVGCELYEVEDGEQLLDYLERRGKYSDSNAYPKPDLLLLDINMPRIDGKQALQRIRQMKTDTRLLPVVVLTTSTNDVDVVESYELGVNAYVSKPVNVDEFVQAMLRLEMFWFELVTLPHNPQLS
ncbi:response regulator [Balneatrix alpica]|uniref:response regulator n=1 Tax=Balneatrix alpica TaxID=75684 RepID=UPI002739EA32|nr:response regulator [Balneatrix alpica]